MIAVINSHPPYTGLGKYALDLWTGIKKHFENSKLIYLETKETPFKENMHNMEKITQTFYLPKYNSIYAHYFYFPKKIPFNYQLYHLTCQYHASIMKYHDNCILTHMDFAPLVMPDKYPLIMVIFNKMLAKWYAKAKRIIVLSEVAKKEVLKFTKANENIIRVVNLGYNEKIYKPYPKNLSREKIGVPLDAKIILFVGRETSYRKNFKIILESMHKLKKINNLILIKIGNIDNNNAKLKEGLKIIERYKIEEELMPFYYSAAEVLILPSIYEGGGYPPIEAMACGTPVIVSEAMEIYKNGAIIISPNKPDELTNALENIICKKDIQEKYSQMALKEANNFTLTKAVELTINIYKEILN